MVGGKMNKQDELKNRIAEYLCQAHDHGYNKIRYDAGQPARYILNLCRDELIEAVKNKYKGVPYGSAAIKAINEVFGDE